jgi:hypothetical protein
MWYDSGWYVKIIKNGYIIEDSEKVSFPINTDAYSESDGDRLTRRVEKYIAKLP